MKHRKERKAWHVLREQCTVQSGQNKGHNGKPLPLRLNKPIQSARDHRFLARLELTPIGTVDTGQVVTGHERDQVDTVQETEYKVQSEWTPGTWR